MRWILRTIRILVLAAVVLIVLAIVFIYSGLFNVAANYPDNPVAAWVLGTTMDHSVRRHAAGIKTPALDDPKMIADGLKLYHSRCEFCHGAPGIHIQAVSKSLNPAPPELTEAAGDWKPNELFWITRNGIRMSGMPAWQVAQTDQQIWSIVAFARKLPSMKSEEYKAATQPQSPKP